MSAQSNKSWRSAVTTDHMRPSRGDPVLQIGSTLKTLYLMDEDEADNSRLSNCLDRLDDVAARSKKNDH